MADKNAKSKSLLPIFKKVDNKIPQSLQKPKPLPGDKSFIGPVTGVQRAEGAVRSAQSAVNQTGITAQQKADRQKTLSRAQAQLNKAKSANKPKSDPKPKTDPKPTSKKPTKPVTTTKKKKVIKNTGSKPGGSTSSDSSGNTDGTDDNVTSVGSVPDSPSPSVTQEDPKTYKPASPDLILLEEEAFPVEVITDLLFEDIGGTEILNFARHDLVSGIDIKYQQISNLAKIDTIYGGANLIALQNTSEQVFKKYPLGRYDFTPEITDDPSGFNSPVYLDAAGNLIVELKNIDNSYQIEIEFQSAKTNDIIY